MFCCHGLEHLCEHAGQSGLAIIAKEVQGDIDLYIQSRGISFDDKLKIMPTPPGYIVDINFFTQSGMRYCPYCGTRLDKFIKNNLNFFRQLAEKHRPFAKDVLP